MIATQHPQTPAMEAILVERNQKLVYKVAMRYGWAKLDLEELFTEGVCGLLTAARRFDISKGCKFSTLAVTWIRQTIGRAAEQSGAISVPSYCYEWLPKLFQAREALGDGATNEELASHLGWRMDRLEGILAAENALRVLELDAPMKSSSGDEPSSYLQMMPSPGAGPEEAALASSQIERVNEMIGLLDEREQQILRLHIGEGIPLIEVGLKLGVTRERTRQLEKRAIANLREIARKEALSGAYVN